MLDIKKGTGFFWDWPVHALCLIMSIIAELIGQQKVHLGILSFTLYPMLYCVLMGIIMGAINLLPMWMMETASPLITVSILMLGARSIATLGPNLGLIVSSGAALLAQELGNLGTIFLSIPVGVLVFGMGRSVVGAGFSISREGSLMVIGNMYGLDSDEGLGVMGGYITGTVFGTIICGLMTSFLVSVNFTSPFALAMACGVGSASMLSANVAPIMDYYPDKADEIYALAYASNTLSGMDGMYMNIFMALPLSNLMYKLCWKLKGKEPPESRKQEVIDFEVNDY